MHVAWLAVDLARVVAWRSWTAETHALSWLAVGLAYELAWRPWTAETHDCTLLWAWLVN